MHVGVKLPSWGPLASSDFLSTTATLAERCGYDSVWVSDHVVMPVDPEHSYPFSADGKPPFDPGTPFQDPFVALAWVASLTTRVQLGIGVLVLPLRHPLHVAKQAATLDALSGGRVVLGVGTGWMREEFELLDHDFENRGRRTDDAIATMRACWRPDPIELHDDRFGPVAMSPKPVHGAALPVLVGGHSVPALRRASRTGDGWYGSNVDVRTFERLAADVRRRREADHPGSRFRVGIKAPLAASADAARHAKEFADAGADFIVFDMDFQHIDATDASAVIERIADELTVAERRDGSEPI